jgi:hypothetical protein
MESNKEKNNMINISQSFLKEYAKYKMGEVCGLQTKAKYIDKVKFPSSDAMEYGNFFEYKATGCLPRDGHEPKPKIVYEGTKRESIAEQYKKAIESAELFKKIIEHYKIEIIDTGRVVTQDGITGIMDIVANWNNRVVIIDTKYSGLLDDKWNPLGWHLDSLPEKHDTMIQSVHYRILLAKELNCEPEDIDFYFFVFSSKEVNDVKLIKVISDENTFANHLTTIEWMKEELKKPIDKLFKPRPELKRCFSCPVKDTCKHKIEIPLISEISY